MQYIPLVTTVSAVSEKGPIPLVAYGDTGARRSIIQEDFYREHLQPLNFQAYTDRMIRVKGVDPSGKGILTDRRVKMMFQTPNGTRFQLDPILMPGLPEQTLFGLDWMGRAKLQIHIAEEPEDCRLVSESSGIMNHSPASKSIRRCRTQTPEQPQHPSSKATNQKSSEG